MYMTIMKKAGFAAAALAVAACLTPASAADLGGYRGNGSIKDGSPVYPPMAQQVHQAPRGPAGPCYFRGDLGYSVSKDPTVKWSVANGGWNYIGEGAYNPATGVYTPPAVPTPGFDPNNAANWQQTSTFIGDGTTKTSLENAWFGGVGIGCGMGSHGIRAEAMLGYTGHRKLQAQPNFYNPAGPQPTVTPVPTPYVPPVDFTDPLQIGRAHV